ncbi:MAG: NAD(P)-binding domain-containing protein, partial [Bacteriovorax sp.]|nr:NAD(P)-binding domain-containing protein [Bacteriovorax sp.]
MKNLVVDKFKSKKAVIGIVGLGYVGLPLALRYSEENFKVIGFDIDQFKVSKINDGQSFIEHISNAAVTAAKKSGFEATTDFKKISDVDAIILCVPTPLTKYREPDLSFVLTTTESIIPYLKAGQIVSLESTTYPGTTEEELLPRIEKSGLKVGENIYL